MRLFQLSFLVIILTFNLSCKKETGSPQIDPPENDTTDNPYGTPFKNVPNTEDIIMYEVNLRAFSQSGDLKGVINRLDELKKLGINVIWLMPIHPIGKINSVNSPYSVKDYTALSSEYGTLQDLRNLTDMAHEKDMAVIMDWVANHTAWDNKWISNKSWYTQDGAGNIVHPPGTNWLDVADLDFDNQEMRLDMIKAMKYWIWEANIDGYRCDYADGVPYSFWKQAFDSLNAIPGRDLVFLAEGGRADHFNAGFQLNFSWDFYTSLKNVFKGQSVQQLFNSHQNEYTDLPDEKHKLRFSTNHDESAWDATPMVLFNGEDGAIAASVITIFMGGVPLFYTGQEVGRVNTVPFFSNSPINWNNKPEMLDEYQQLIRFYSQSEVSKKGRMTNHSNSTVLCLNKTLDSEELLIIVNTRNAPIVFSLPIGIQNSTWTDAMNDYNVALGNSIQLSNYQYLVLKN